MARPQFCIVVMLCLLVPACRRIAPTPAPSPSAVQAVSPDYLTLANRAFARADYGEAAKNYEHYLEINPSPQHRDEILFRLAVSYAVEESPVRDTTRAVRLLEEIRAQFPTGPWRDQAQLALSLRDTANRLSIDDAEKTSRIATLESELAAVKGQEAECRTVIEQLQSAETHGKKDRDTRIRQLTATIEELQDKNRSLTAELETLKKIDLQRRPSRPPR